MARMPKKSVAAAITTNIVYRSISESVRARVHVYVYEIVCVLAVSSK